MTQISSFEKLQQLCSEVCHLAFFDPKKQTTIQCDASCFTLGAALMQNREVIAYASLSLTVTKQRYSQTEKELLAVVFGCKKFHQYVFGATVTIKTDHKPLISIMRKPIEKIPARLQTMMLQIQPYDIHLEYRKGKDMMLADTLSRVSHPDKDDLLTAQVKVHRVSLINDKRREMVEVTHKELSCSRDTILQGWPDHHIPTDRVIRSYWCVRDALTMVDGLLLTANWLAIPSSQRANVLNLLHKAHLGINRCKQHARETCYCSGMHADLDKHLSYCAPCLKNQSALPKQKMELRDLPKKPLEHGSTKTKNMLL